MKYYTDERGRLIRRKGGRLRIWNPKAHKYVNEWVPTYGGEVPQPISETEAAAITIRLEL